MTVRLRSVGEQVIVITGASSGIGRATALMAASRGATVVAAARGSEGLDTLVAEIAAAGGRAAACPTDMTDAAAVDRLAAFAVQRYGRIDTWVNNAGVAIAGKLEDISEDDARSVFEVNFWGMVHGCKAALPFLKREGGVIVNLGSVTSDVAAPFMGLYSATKHAIKGYTDALRIELMIDRAPVAVTLVKPAPIATPVLEHQRNRMDEQATMPPPFYRPEDVATAILSAAENPERDLHVGGTVRLGSILAQAFPNVADAAAALLGPRLFKTGAPRDDRPDNLDEPTRVTVATHGDTHGHWSHASIYTRLTSGHRSLVGRASRRLLQGLRRTRR